MSNKEIASQLSISGQTVKNHITSILSKLQVNDRTMAVIYAIQRGWIKMGAEKGPEETPKPTTRRRGSTPSGAIE
jgi:predicted transcriptional regulator